MIDQHPDIVNAIDSIATIARNDLGDYLFNIKGKGQREPGYAFTYNNKVEHRGLHAVVSYELPYSAQYDGGGNAALTDGITGFSEVSHKAWQGFEGKDMKATIALNDTLRLHNIRVGILCKEDSWVFKPLKITVSYSLDNVLICL